MIKEISAGGVVIFGNALLLLRKFNGDWVLPKGGVEKGETLRETALREVFEESGVKADIEEYIGKAIYNYKDYKTNKQVEKTVHWYLMKTYSMESVPQKSEGFIEAKFIHIDRAEEFMKYKDEKKIIEKGLNILE